MVCIIFKHSKLDTKQTNGWGVITDNFELAAQ